MMDKALLIIFLIFGFMYVSSILAAIDEESPIIPKNTTEGSELELHADARIKCTGPKYRRRTFGRVVDDKTREPCITIAPNKPQQNETGPLCANITNRIEMDWSENFNIVRIRIKDCKTSDSGRYFLDTEDVKYCVSRTNFEITVVRPPVADKDKTTYGTTAKKGGVATKSALGWMSLLFVILVLHV